MGLGDSCPKAMGLGDSCPKAMGLGDSCPKAMGLGDSCPKAMGLGESLEVHPRYRKAQRSHIQTVGEPELLAKDMKKHHCEYTNLR